MVTKMQNIKTTVNSVFLFFKFLSIEMWPLFFYAKPIGTWLEWMKKRGGAHTREWAMAGDFRPSPPATWLKLLSLQIKYTSEAVQVPFYIKEKT